MLFLIIASKSVFEEPTVLGWLAVIGLLILTVLGILFTSAMFESSARDMEVTVRKVGSAIKDSNWYKAREERKEIEALERQLKKKKLQKQAGKTRMRKRRTK